MNLVKEALALVSALQSKDHTVLVPSPVLDFAAKLLATLESIDKHLEFRNAHTMMTSTIQCHQCHVPAKGKEAPTIVWYPAAAEQCPTCGSANPLSLFGERYGR